MLCFLVYLSSCHLRVSSNLIFVELSRLIFQYSGWISLGNGCTDFASWMHPPFYYSSMVTKKFQEEDGWTQLLAPFSQQVSVVLWRSLCTISLPIKNRHWKSSTLKMGPSLKFTSLWVSQNQRQNLQRRLPWWNLSSHMLPLDLFHSNSFTSWGKNWPRHGQ